MPSDDRPWLAGMDRLDDPRLAPPFRHLAPALPPAASLPLGAAAGARRLALFLPRRVRGRRSRARLPDAPAAERACRGRTTPPGSRGFIVTLVIAVALLAVLALVVAITSPRHLARPRWGRPARSVGRRSGRCARPIAHAQLELDGEDALDATRAAVEAGAVRAHRRRRAGARADAPRLRVLRLPGSNLRGRARAPRATSGSRPRSCTTARSRPSRSRPARNCTCACCLAEADLPLATMGERLVTPDTVVKGRSRAADVHPELAASWPGGASWPPAPEVAADRIRVRRIRRIAATSCSWPGPSTSSPP